MSNPMSTGTRLTVVLGLVAAGQACVIAGSSLGWSPAAIIGGSLGATALGLGLLVSGMSTLRGALRAVHENLDRIVSLDLSQEVPQIGGGTDSGQLLHKLQALQVTLRQSIGSIRSGADSVTTAAAEIASGNNDLSHRTEQTAGNLQSAASSVSQLSNTVRQSADSAAQANQLANSAAQVARRGGEVVGQVVSTMDEINASSKKIADIIGVIDGIAFQTNILALNAAVEAARAGEQGRGFAVVASEVRSLAQRSAEAAREIKTLIGNSVDKVETGSKLVADAGATMTEIVSSVQRVSDIIGEISAAATEQSSGIGQVNTAVTQLDQATQQNAALVEQSAAAAESLREQAGRLASVVGVFRLGNGATAPARSVSAVPVAAAVHVQPAVKAPPAAGKAAAARPAAPAAAPKPVAKAAAKPVPTPAAPAARREPLVAPAPAAPAPVAAGGDDDWTTF